MESVIELRNVSVNFAGATVLEDISLKIDRGDFVALMGPNGAGKTTLIRTVLGFVPSFSGQILLFGKELDHFKERYRIGYVAQRAYFEKSFPINVSEVISLGLVPRTGLLHQISKHDRERVSQSLEKVGLKGLECKRATELSGGQQQRVLIAKALVGRPDLLILDEPTASTDVNFMEQFWVMLEKFNSEDNLTILIITHQSDIKPPAKAKVALLNKRLIHYCGWESCKSSMECAALAGIRPQG
jgi:zinc transport system ATP-binding protein